MADRLRDLVSSGWFRYAVNNPREQHQREEDVRDCEKLTCQDIAGLASAHTARMTSLASAWNSVWGVLEMGFCRRDNAHDLEWSSLEFWSGTIA
jgi:hypothetical protein